MEFDGPSVPLLGRDHPQKDKKNWRCQVPYTWLFWSVFLLTTVLCIVDRFLWNPLPLTFGFPPLSQSLEARGIFVPASVLVFDIFSRVTGRLFLVVVDGLFLTQCKTLETLLQDHCPRWLNIGDLRSTHNRIHYVLGVFFMTIPMLVHVWIVFVPSMFGVPISTAATRPPTKVASLSPCLSFLPVCLPLGHPFYFPSQRGDQHVCVTR